MKKIFFAGLLFFAAHYTGHAQRQLPPVKQGSDAPARVELPIKGGGTQNGTHTASQSAAQGPSQAAGATNNVASLKAGIAAGVAKPPALSNGSAQTLQSAPLKGGGTASGTSGPTKLPIKTGSK